MRLEARQVAGFLRNPGAIRFVLLYGDDDGLIRERSRVLTRQVAGTLGDPFLIVELVRDGWNRIPEEMAALSMIGGRRVVVVRDAADGVVNPVSEALKGPGQALLILEAAGLGRGKLRSLAEGSSQGCAIACYPEEGQALAGVIARQLADAGVKANAEAIAWLSQALSGDRAIVRAEVEKLALFAGGGEPLDIETARACVGMAAATASDDGLLAATLGELAACDAAVENALADGVNGVALLRMANGHLQRLQIAKLHVASGASPVEAVKAMRPPVFYRAATRLAGALAAWTVDALSDAIEEARQVELACKQTGSRPDVLARHFIQVIARKAARRGNRAVA